MNNPVDTVFIFGAKYLYLAVGIIAVIWFLFLPLAEKKKVFILACVCLPLIFAVSFLAGKIYYNARPFAVDCFTPLVPHKADNGFPSHHTLLASAIAAIIFPFSRRVSLLLWILTLFVGISRVYAGVHHIADIIGSMLISIVSVSAVYLFMRYFKGIQIKGGLK